MIKEVMGQQNSCETLVGVHLTMHLKHPNWALAIIITCTCTLTISIVWMIWMHVQLMHMWYAHAYRQRHSLAPHWYNYNIHVYVGVYVYVCWEWIAVILRDLPNKCTHNWHATNKHTYILQALFGSIEQIFKSRLRMQLVRLGITNNGSTQHG